MRRAIWINALLGLWLIISPSALGYARASTLAVLNDLILGVLVLVSAVWVAAGLTRAVEMAAFGVVCGLWLLIAPFVLGIAQITIVAWNDVIVGLVVIVVSLVETSILARRPVGLA